MDGSSESQEGPKVGLGRSGRGEAHSRPGCGSEGSRRWRTGVLATPTNSIGQLDTDRQQFKIAHTRIRTTAP